MKKKSQQKVGRLATECTTTNETRSIHEILSYFFRTRVRLLLRIICIIPQRRQSSRGVDDGITGNETPRIE
jgi:hypothetical protein